MKNLSLHTNRDEEEMPYYIERLLSNFPNLREDILEFLYRHNSYPEIIDILEVTNLTKLTCTEIMISIEKLINIQNLFPDYVEETMCNPIPFLEMRRKDDMLYWQTHGTWRVPVLIFSPKPRSKTGLIEDILIEGHTRLGILNGLLKAKNDSYQVSPHHSVIILQEG